MRLFNVHIYFVPPPAGERLHYWTWWLIGALVGASECSPFLFRLLNRVLPERFQFPKGRSHGPHSDGYDTVTDAPAFSRFSSWQWKRS